MLTPLIFLIFGAAVLAMMAVLRQRARAPAFRLARINPQAMPPWMGPCGPEPVAPAMMEAMPQVASSPARQPPMVRCPGEGGEDLFRFPGLLAKKLNDKKKDASLEAPPSRPSRRPPPSRPSRPGLRRELARLFQSSVGRDEARLHLTALKSQLPPAQARLAEEVFEEVFPHGASFPKGSDVN